MNQVLEIAGSFIYVALSIVLLPVFILFDMVLGTWLLVKWTRRHSKNIALRFQHKQAGYQLGVKKALALTRARVNNAAH
jgi:hypothetical protein